MACAVLCWDQDSAPWSSRACRFLPPNLLCRCRRFYWMTSSDGFLPRRIAFAQDRNFKVLFLIRGVVWQGECMDKRYKTGTMNQAFSIPAKRFPFWLTATPLVFLSTICDRARNYELSIKCQFRCNTRFCWNRQLLSLWHEVGVYQSQFNQSPFPSDHLPSILLRLCGVPILICLMSSINRAEVPESWQSYLHPNLDVYYFNLGLRLLTTDDIRKPELRALLLEIRNDCFEELAEDSGFQKLPIDWVMTITDCDLTERTALVGIHSRSLATSYRWSEPGKLDWLWLIIGIFRLKIVFFCDKFCHSENRLDGMSERSVLGSYRWVPSTW